MDELDKLKNNWKKDQGSYPTFSEKDIYGMLHKKSSSVVKWILIISILEFVFWLGLSLVLKDNPTTESMETLDLDYIMLPMSLVSYAIALYFVCIFYTRYKKIAVTDTIKQLMENILMTRKAVSAYIYVTIAYAIVCAIIIVIVLFNMHPGLIDVVHRSEEHGQKLLFYLLAFIVVVIILGIFIFAMWLFYKVIYGLLLKRLYKNYEELKKIDF